MKDWTRERKIEWIIGAELVVWLTDWLATVLLCQNFISQGTLSLLWHTGDSMVRTKTSRKNNSDFSAVARIFIALHQVTIRVRYDYIGTNSHGNLPSTRLSGSAIYRKDGSRKVLYLNGKTYAETPAVDFRTISFTIAFWVKSRGPDPDKILALYADWYNPHQFCFAYFPSRSWTFRMHNINNEVIVYENGG